LLWNPPGLEPKRLHHRKRVATDDAHGGAYVWDSTILSLVARRRNLGRHDATIGRRRQRIGDQEPIATDLNNLVVRQVRRLPFVDHASHEA